MIHRLFHNTLIYLKKINAKLHLKYKCVKCPTWKRRSRDIYNHGECYWYANWKKNNYNIQSYYLYLIKKTLSTILHLRK